MRMEDDMRKNILSLALLTLCGVLGAGCTDTDTDTGKVQSQTPSYKLSANQLCSEYNANEIAADRQYKEKVVLVSGTILNIGKDILDRAYVVIGGQGLLDGVQCTFTKGEESSLVRLRKGQEITVKGEVAGKMMGNVLLNKCRLQ